MRNSVKSIGWFSVIFYLYCIITWGTCIYKAANCNWEPIGKAEVVYTVGAVTPACVVIAWINVQDK